MVRLSTELGSAFISVGLGTNTLAGDIKKAFGASGDVGEKAGKEAGSRFGGAVGLAAAAVGALGIGSFFKSAIGGAADLEQSVGAIDSVFKGSAGQMHEWAQSAATDVGLSANEFNELGTLIGSQLKNGGTAMDELGPKTRELISTGADLASMFGGTTSEAVDALSSALKGERDPIERYGVSLNQAKIDAEAAALGFGKVNGQFEQNAQQAATLSLITKQTADATGNFGRETDTLAHKQQVLNAQLANGKARIGTELLPVVAALTGALSKALGPAINVAVSGIHKMVAAGQGLYDLFINGDFTGKLSEAFNIEEDSKIVGFILGVREAFSDLKAGFTLPPIDAAGLGESLSGLVRVGFTVKAGFETVLGGLRDFVAGFTLPPIDAAGLGESLTGLVRVGFTVKAALVEVTGGVRAMFAAFKAGDGDVTSDGFAGAMERIGNIAREVVDNVVVSGKILAAGFKMPLEVAAGFGTNLNPLLMVGVKVRETFTALGVALAGVWSAVGPQLAALVPQVFALFQALSPTSLLFQALLPVLPQIATAIGGVLASVLPLALSLTSQLLPIITQLVSAVLPPLIAIFSDVVTAIAPLVTQIAGLLIPIIQALMPVVVTVFSVVADVVKSAMQIVQGIIQVVTGIISGDWGRVWEGIGNIFDGIWNTIVSVVKGALQIVGQVVISGLGVLGSFVGDALGNIGRFFSDTWNNVVNGVSGMIGNVLGFFGDLGGKIVGAMGNIGSTLFNTGKNIIQGLIDGIGSMMGSIGRAVISIVPEAIRGPFEDLLGIHSPSRVFREYGVNIGQGLILGIDGMHGKVANSVTGLVNVPSAPNFSAGSYTPVSAGIGATGSAVSIGTVHVRDENEMARLILNKQRDAQAAYGF